MTKWAVVEIADYWVVSVKNFRKKSRAIKYIEDFHKEYEVPVNKPDRAGPDLRWCVDGAGDLFLVKGL